MGAGVPVGLAVFLIFKAEFLDFLRHSNVSFPAAVFPPLGQNKNASPLFWSGVRRKAPRFHPAYGLRSIFTVRCGWRDIFRRDKAQERRNTVCISSFCNAVSAEEIRRWHTAPPNEGGRGWKQVGYTDLFHLNGGVERLVNNNEDANVDPWEVTNGVAGYNSVSRHIVYAGGCAKDGKTPADTRTSWQKKALEKYVKDFHRRFPDVRIVGHNELAAKACPSFDVQRWLKQIGITQ